MKTIYTILIFSSLLLGACTQTTSNPPEREAPTNGSGHGSTQQEAPSFISE